MYILTASGFLESLDWTAVLVCIGIGLLIGLITSPASDHGGGHVLFRQDGRGGSDSGQPGIERTAHPVIHAETPPGPGHGKYFQYLFPERIPEGLFFRGKILSSR